MRQDWQGGHSISFWSSNFATKELQSNSKICKDVRRLEKRHVSSICLAMVHAMRTKMTMTDADPYTIMYVIHAMVHTCIHFVRAKNVYTLTRFCICACSKNMDLTGLALRLYKMDKHDFGNNSFSVSAQRKYMNSFSRHRRITPLDNNLRVNWTCKKKSTYRCHNDAVKREGLVTNGAQPNRRNPTGIQGSSDPGIPGSMGAGIP